MGVDKPLDWMIRVRQRFESVLLNRLLDFSGPSVELNEAVRYALLNGGKRLRALLVYAAGEAVGTPVEQLDDAACAIEALHAYSLVHDDLPCMDNDVLRRGKPTCHVKFGEAIALLAGDALQTAAFHWLAFSSSGSAEARLAQIATLARASGLLGMAAGQAIDLLNVGRAMDFEALQEMHARKTGDLIAASIRLGYLSSNNLDATLIAAFDVLAQALGFAYQIKDDILDVEASSDVLGKTSGKDAANNKPTMVSMLGLEQAKAKLLKLHDEALSACVELDASKRAPLEMLVELITNRSS
jgi:geranylgeranyl pyrophosphate synthase